ncbi:MAG: hypothetical protein ACRC68_03670 [Clostridium sp.]
MFYVLFLLVNPGSGDRVAVRLLSLVVGAIFIMLLQVLFNKNRFSKEGNKLLINVCDNLLNSIKNIKNNSQNTNIDISTSINAFINMIHDKRDSDYYLTEEGQTKLNISVALQEIGEHLDNIKYTKSLDLILDDLYYIIENTKVYLDKNEILINFEDESKNLVNKYQELDETNYSVLEILNSIIDLCDVIIDFENLEDKNYNLINKIEEIPNDFSYSLCYRFCFITNK